MLLRHGRPLARALHGRPLRVQINGRACYHDLHSRLDESLRATQPRFITEAETIRILKRPDEFYHTLLDMIRRAERRILISSLYIGTEETELMSTLENALERNADLQVHLVLDLNRSTRHERRGTVLSTAHLLAPLVKKYPNRLTVSMFRSPKLRGIMAKIVPPRFNEGWGTWHAKIYAVDDEVMFSGANLNSSYFSDRQDRYIHFSDHPSLVAYLSSFLKTVGSFSFQLLPPSSSSSSSHSYYPLDKAYHLHWSNPVPPTSIEGTAGTILRELQRTHILSSSREDDKDTVVFPLIQSGILGVREEELGLATVFDTIASSVQELGSDKKNEEMRPLVQLTSGYFSLYEPWQRRAIQERAVDWQIVAAAPEANGFFGSAGLSGRIPDGYTLLERAFWQRVRKAGRAWFTSLKPQTENDGARDDTRIVTKDGHGVQLRLWQRPGWTYHAKGIWISPTRDANGPSITLFGSTNLNSRSARLDSELSFVLITRSKSLQARLGEEVRLLREDAREGVYDRDSDEWKQREISWATRAITWLVKSML